MNELAHDLAELLEAENQVGSSLVTTDVQPPIAAMAFPRVIRDRVDLEAKLRAALNSTNHIVAKYKPDDYTISIGFPLGVSVSFTWSTGKYGVYGLKATT